MRRNYIFIGQKVIQLVINNPFKAENGTPFFSPPVARAPRRASPRRPLLRGENDSK